MHFVRVSIIGILMSGTAAIAGDKPVIAPAPDWIAPLPPTAIAKPDPNGPLLLVLDQQQRIVDGQVWAYQDTAMRIASAEILGQAGNLRMAWQPEDGDLIVHRVSALRDGQEVDLLKQGQGLTVLRREAELEALQINGLLTATLAIEDLRVGDVLRVTYSVTRRDKMLAGQAQTLIALPGDPVRLGFGRTRLLWPKASPVKVKLLTKSVTPTITDQGAMREMLLPLPLPKAEEMPDDAPARFRSQPLLEASTFADWSAVSRTMEPLYRTQGLIAPGSALAEQVARIEKAESDPMRRAAAALRLVQDEVRYLAVGMDGGNYRPQTPAQTWTLRYGDCKAKTLMLLAVLHGLGIEAEPVLAHLGLGDVVTTRLPSAAAFNHVLVKAKIGDQILWLDGTGLGTRLDDLADTPAIGWVLPLRANGAQPEQIATRPDRRPAYRLDVRFDQTAGIRMPSLYTATVVMRGREAGLIGSGMGSVEPAKRRELVESMIAAAVPDSQLTRESMSFDKDSGQLTITASGVAMSGWSREENRWVRTLDRTLGDLSFEPDRARSEWQALPVRTAQSGKIAYRQTIVLPEGGRGFTLEGDQTLPATLAGAVLERKVERSGAEVSVIDTVAPVAGEIAPADVTAERERVAAAQTRLLRLVAPGDSPSRLRLVRAGLASGRFKALEAAYTDAIAADPESTEPYLNRSQFRAGIYDFRGALPDLDKAIAKRPDRSLLLRRSGYHHLLGDKVKALADAERAYAIDPSGITGISQLSWQRIYNGKEAEAMALVDQRIAAGGKDKPDYQLLKADLLVYLGRGEEAVALADAAVGPRGSNASQLNERCWVKATSRVQLDTALKDCSRSIELGENPASAYDSRALVYLQLGRIEEALADIDAALELEPDMAASLYLRGLIRKKQGVPGADDDLAEARLASPRIDEKYARYRIPGF